MLVRAEACSWFLHRYGEEAAPHFQLFIEQLDHLTVLDATPSHHPQVAGHSTGCVGRN